jgi:hypothetical protein
MSSIPSPFKSAEAIEVYMVNGVSKLAAPPQPGSVNANRRGMLGNLRRIWNIPTTVSPFLPQKKAFVCKWFAIYTDPLDPFLADEK